jgi:hypothetical protein
MDIELKQNAQLLKTVSRPISSDIFLCHIHKNGTCVILRFSTKKASGKNFFLGFSNLIFSKKSFEKDYFTFLMEHPERVSREERQKSHKKNKRPGSPGCETPAFQPFLPRRFVYSKMSNKTVKLPALEQAAGPERSTDGSRKRNAPP